MEDVKFLIEFISMFETYYEIITVYNVIENIRYGISRDMLEKYDITIKKFRNIRVDSESIITKRSIQKFQNNTYDIVLYGELLIKPSKSLECTWWFMYYINSIFDCGKGRLLQFSATCYLNAVLNGFILSKFTSKFLLNFMSQQPDRKMYIPFVCPNPMTNKYLFTIIYNTLCRKESMTEEYEDKDMLIDFSKLKVKNNSLNLLSEKEIGGYTISTMISLLSWITDNKFNHVYVEPSGELSVGNWDEELDFNKDYDFLFFDPFSTNTVFTSLFNFGVEFCTISTLYTKTSGGSGAHAILGYKCDGIYKIYDSNSILIHTFDWRRLNEQEYQDKLVEILNTSYGFIYTFSRPIIDCILYINKNKRIETSTAAICASI